MHLPTRLCIIDTVLQSNIISYLKSRLDLLYHKHLFSLLCKYIHVLCAGPIFFSKTFFLKRSFMQNTSLVKMTEVSKTPIFLLYHVFFKFWTFKSIVNVFIYTYTLTNIISKTLINAHTFEFFHLDILPLK